MAAGRPKKRASDTTKQAPNGNDQVTTPPMQRSPIKQRKMGLTLHQKQALIDNLQLEITERARRLRAQYHIQAQGLRSRIDIRINRIPMSLRKVKMEELLLKYAEKQQRAVQATIPPPVPAKDGPIRSPRKPVPQNTTAQTQRPGRPLKRTSGEMSYDKENDIENMEQPKKRTRAQVPDGAPVRPGQVLSPTSSNSRLNNGRPVSPMKSQIARPGSPLKGTGVSRSAAATNLLSNIVEKAKSSRAATGVRKVTATSNASSSSAGAPAPATRTRRAAAAPAPRAPPSRPATHTGRRISAGSEASDGSTSTVVRKTASKPATAAAKRKGLASFTKGTASGDAKKATTAKPAAPTTTRTGRVLRNRG